MSKAAQQYNLDRSLVFATAALLIMGLIMVGSASISIAAAKLDQPLFYFIRQVIFAVIGVGIAFYITTIPLSVWR